MKCDNITIRAKCKMSPLAEGRELKYKKRWYYIEQNGRPSRRGGN